MQNYSLVRRGPGTAVLEPSKVPALPDDYVLVKTKAVALNPTDWTTLDAVGDDGTIVGCDYAGVVEDAGRDAAKRFRKGDRIAGFGHGGNDAKPETGAFARYIAVKSDLQMHIPDDVSFEAASTVGVGIGTTGYALYHVLNLRSGYNVITTCSPQNFDYVKGLGADKVFDYVRKTLNPLFLPYSVFSSVQATLTLTKRAPDVGREIFEATKRSIKKVFDTVSTEDSAAICAAAFGSTGGTYCNLLGTDCPRSDVESVFFLGYDMSGEAYMFEGDSYPARPEALAFGRKWYEIAEELWAAGKWQPHRQKVGGEGLLGVLDGLQMMRQGLVSGEKLVYRVDETEWPSPV